MNGAIRCAPNSNDVMGIQAGCTLEHARHWEPGRCRVRASVGRGHVSPYRVISARGAFRDYVPDAACCRLSCFQHRRGLRAAKQSRADPISLRGIRIGEGTRLPAPHRHGPPIRRPRIRRVSQRRGKARGEDVGPSHQLPSQATSPETEREPSVSDGPRAVQFTTSPTTSPLHHGADWCCNQTGLILGDPLTHHDGRTSQVEAERGPVTTTAS